jgi:hypothetical protein
MEAEQPFVGAGSHERVCKRCPPCDTPESSLRWANGLPLGWQFDRSMTQLRGDVPFSAQRWPRPDGLSRVDLPNNAKARERTKQATRQFDCQLYS